MKVEHETISIAGAGLAGSYLAILFALEGFDVDVYESRADMRTASVEAGRSINLAISKRGLDALKRVGLEDKLEGQLIPMKGRKIHQESGELSFQSYSSTQGEGINSVSRSQLNQILMTKAEDTGRVTIHFSSPVESVNLSKKTVKIGGVNPREVNYQKLVGTDGAGSPVRQALVDDNAEFNPQMLGYGYKELTIPPTQNGDFAMEAEALHIWPRKKFMLIALPNPDKSFTGTLFLPENGGGPSFESIDSNHALTNLFDESFSDARDLIPNLEGEFFENPTGILGTIRLSRWHSDDHTLVLGDAAHGVVPFYGQGMNCALESCHQFVDSLKSKGFDWADTLDAFVAARKPQADAIADLAIQNFDEMQDHVADPKFLLEKKILQKMEDRIPDFLTEYSLVTFSNTPYLLAKRLGMLQKKLVKQLSEGISKVEDIDWQKADLLSKEYFESEIYKEMV